MDIKDDLQVWFISFLMKKTESAVGETDNEELSQKLHRPMAKKFKRGKVCVRFKYNIWTTDLPEMGSLSSKNWGLNIYYVS